MKASSPCTRPTRKTKIGIVSLLLVFFCAAHVQGQDADVLVGKWNITAKANESEGKSVWEFKREGDKYTGVYTGQDDGPIEFTNLQFKDGTLSTDFETSASGTQMRIEIEAQIEGDAIKGKWSATETTNDAEIASGTLVGERQKEWIQLFNGKDLDGWTAKIRGHELGDNYADTFRVEEGLLTVSYADYKPEDSLSTDGKQRPSWDKFGHLFYKDKFSHYVLRAEYRFVGDQVANGPGWAFRNNGLMLHGQDPSTMTVDQDFPVSIEVQLLGGSGQGDRTTINLCTPGTNVVLSGELFKRHCTSSTSPTFHGDDWVTVEIEVRGNDIIRHKIDDRTYLEYSKPQYDPRDGNAKKLIGADGNLLLNEGTISIQSESHPTQFRKIELKVLDK